MKRARTRGMRKEYDFSGGVRGKYARQVAAGSNLVVLDPDLVPRFRDSKSVNEALRGLIELADRKVARRR